MEIAAHHCATALLSPGLTERFKVGERAFGIWADWLVHNGASIVTVPGGEVYTAIQTKILDAAAFGSPDAWAGMKMHEVCKYYLNPSVIPYDIVEVIMNLKNHAAAKVLLLHPVKDANHGHFDEVCCRSLNGGVDGGALGKLTRGHIA